MKQPRERRMKSRKAPKEHSVKSRLTEDERRRLAEFFILLDQMDRSQSYKERKAA